MFYYSTLGQQSSSPRLPSPAQHTVWPERSSTCIPLKWISQHLLGPHVTPTEGGMAIETPGTQRLSYKEVWSRERLWPAHSSREQTESLSRGHSWPWKLSPYGGDGTVSPFGLEKGKVPPVLFPSFRGDRLAVLYPISSRAQTPH